VARVRGGTSSLKRCLTSKEDRTAWEKWLTMTSSKDHVPGNRDRRRTYALAGSIILYLIACVTPALILHVGQHLGIAGFHWQHYQSITGIHLLLTGLAFGWLRMNFTAFANLLLWASWTFYLRDHYRASRLCAWLALILSVETLQLIAQPYLWDEGATREGYLAAPNIGFLCWIASMVLMAAASQRQLSTRRESAPDSISL
jgi:hypothetical protein